MGGMINKPILYIILLCLMLIFSACSKSSTELISGPKETSSEAIEMSKDTNAAAGEEDKEEVEKQLNSEDEGKLTINIDPVLKDSDRNKTIDVDKKVEKIDEEMVSRSNDGQPISEKQPPLNDKVVVIDPGHSSKWSPEKEPNAPGSKIMKLKDSGGAAGIVTKTPEYKVNMEVAQRLRRLLEQKGFKVIMTKTENDQKISNIERAKLGNKVRADLVVRIHSDSNDNSSINGASMLLPAKVNKNTKAIYEESKRCGQIVLDTVTGQVGMKNRGLSFRKDMTGFNWSEVPVILIEMGFLSNPKEDKLLNSPNYQDKLAQSLSKGIEKALK
jgi:N-acetylmuramoyl-L-alanine amidase